MIIIFSSKFVIIIIIIFITIIINIKLRSYYKNLFKINIFLTKSKKLQLVVV